MTKTKKILATVAALGAMTVGSFAFAAPGEDPRGGSGVPPCAEKRVAAQDWMMARYQSLGEMLTLTAEQKPLWKAYVDARLSRVMLPDADKPVVDVQQRLERRAERLAARAERVKKIADTRAALLKSLSVEQKYVLESYEFHHRRGAQDRGGEWERYGRPNPHPGMPHHRDFGPGYGPFCPWQ